MKFPKATVLLVSAALLVVLWNQFRAQPQPLDTGRFTNLAANPVERTAVVDWAISQIPTLCEEATGQSHGSDAFTACVASSEAHTSSCRRAMYREFPSVIASDEVFRDLSISTMNCLVRYARPLD